MLIISIDPGYDRLGFSVLEKKTGQREKIIFSGILQSDPKKNFKERLFEIALAFEKILDDFSPQVLAIEKLFFNTNQKTATNISEIRGALIVASLKKKMLVFEYTPLEIKTAICGYGRAEKKQIISMLEKLVEIKKEIKHDDEYDAIACGLTFFAIDFKNLNLVGQK